MSLQATRKHHLLKSAVVLVTFIFGPAGLLAADPPSQASSGPGGSNYVHRSAAQSKFGQGGDEYWIFTPTDPRPATAPVVVFMHGWGAIEPSTYGAWIKHLVRRGHIVIYPRFQENLRTPIAEMVPNTIRAVKDAYERLKRAGPVQPIEGQVAVIGHSIGGYIAPNLAANYREAGISAPLAIMVVQPSNGTPMLKNPKRILQLENQNLIPSETLVLAVFGEDDRLAKDYGARAILGGLNQIPVENKALLMIRSDDHPDPPLVADHSSATSADLSFLPLHKSEAPAADASQTRRHGPGKRLGQRLRERRPLRGTGGAGRLLKASAPDALDYYGYWKLCDGLLDAAFRNKNRRFALGNTREQKFMGSCSDGKAVKQAVVLEAP